ncbi:MAG: twitch domain-containing radical SAM protein [Bacteriovoracia bacterium]
MAKYTKKLPENFCILPFTTMLVRADASVSVCCLNSSSATNEGGEQLHLYKDPLKRAFHSPLFQELRADMSAGKRHPSCENCWRDDDAGIPSKRIADNEIWGHWVDPSLEGKGPDSPIDVSFNLGTLCNLKCRICGSTSSSRWAQEYLELFGTDHIPRNNDFIKKMPLEESRALLSNWPQKNPELTSTIFEWLPHMERMEFLGGEPFLNMKQFEIVAKSVEIGAAKNQALHFATNGSQFPDESAREKWSHFKYVNVNISVDGLRDQFEYQRFGAKWDQALANIEKYRALDSVDLVQIYLSISVFTVFYLPEILSFWHKRGLNVCLSTVTNPHRFDARVIPPPLKKMILEKYTHYQNELPADLREKMNGVGNFMNSADHSNLWLKFIESVWFHDDYRKQSFSQTFPEFHAEIERQGFWYDYVSQKDLFLQHSGEEPIPSQKKEAVLGSSVPIPKIAQRKTWISRFMGRGSDSL